MKTIIINGRKFDWEHDQISYEDILTLINTSWASVTYSSPNYSMGILSQGQSTQCNDGMIIHAHNTSNA